MKSEIWNHKNPAFPKGHPKVAQRSAKGRPEVNQTNAKGRAEVKWAFIGLCKWYVWLTLLSSQCRIYPFFAFFPAFFAKKSHFYLHRWKKNRTFARFFGIMGGLEQQLWTIINNSEPFWTILKNIEQSDRKKEMCCDEKNTFFIS